MLLNEKLIRNMIRKIILKEAAVGSDSFDGNYYPADGNSSGHKNFKNSDVIEPDSNAVIKGDKFIVHGVEFQSEPADGAGNVAFALWQSAESAGQKSIEDLGLPKKNGVTQGWESTSAGRAWVSKHIYDASKSGSGAKYGPLLGTKNESHWSSWFFSVAYKGFESEGGAGSSYFDYGADEGMKKRENVLKNPESYKDKIIFMTFAPNEAPLFKGDSVFAHRAEKKGAGFTGIGNPTGPSHMRILVDDSGTVCGGNELCKVGKGKVSLNDDKTLIPGQKYNGEEYCAVYKRVKVLGKSKS